MADRTYSHQLDAKNRMRIPAKLREELGESYFITIGTGGCLCVYTEEQMEKRIRKLQKQIKKHKGVDVVVTHAPVRGFGDEDTLVHRGFEAFLPLLETHQPRYWAYGHVHMRYGHQKPRLIQHGDTTLVNACERYLLEIEP